MGIIKRGILGGFAGKVANVVGSSWRGISYIKALPLSVANPRTEGQVNQRNKFTAVTQFLQPNSAMVALGYKAYATGMTARNAAFSYLIQNAITGTAPDFSVDPALALLSRGKLQKAVGQTAGYLSDELTVGWTANSTQFNASPTDVAMVLAYNAAKKESVFVLEGITRADATAVLDIPTYFAGDEVEVYLAFRAADGSMVSDSVHVGTITIE